MGNKWSASPSFTSEIVNDDDGEPPDEAAAAESTLTVTFIESKHLNLNSVLGSGKHNALIRVVNSFNEQSFTKPMKFDQNTWYMPKRRFVFSSNDPDGEIRVCLLQNHLPPLPAVPSTENLDNCLRCSSGLGKEKLVLAKMVIPVSLVELKQAKRVDRWITVEAPGLSNLVTGEVPQVRISLDFNFKPSRIVDSVDSLNRKYDIEDTLGAGVSVVKKSRSKAYKKGIRCQVPTKDR